MIFTLRRLQTGLDAPKMRYNQTVDCDIQADPWQLVSHFPLDHAFAGSCQSPAHHSATQQSQQPTRRFRTYQTACRTCRAGPVDPRETLLFRGPPTNQADRSITNNQYFYRVTFAQDYRLRSTNQHSRSRHIIALECSYRGEVENTLP